MAWYNYFSKDQRARRHFKSNQQTTVTLIEAIKREIEAESKDDQRLYIFVSALEKATADSNYEAFVRTIQQLNEELKRRKREQGKEHQLEKMLQKELNEKFKLMAKANKLAA